MSPLVLRDLGVAELGKNRGSLDGAAPSSLVRAFLPIPPGELLRRALLFRPPSSRDLAAEPGAKSGLLLVVFRAGVPWLPPAGRAGEEDEEEGGKARGEELRTPFRPRLAATAPGAARCPLTVLMAGLDEGAPAAPAAPFAAPVTVEGEDGKARGEEDRGA